MTDYMDDKEIFGEELDAFIEMLGYRLEEERIHILVPDRIRDMQISYNAISSIVLPISPDAKIDAKLSELTPTHGCIAVETDELVIKDTEAFVISVEEANNFEIYPLSNGNIKMAITFHGIMREIDRA